MGRNSSRLFQNAHSASYAETSSMLLGSIVSSSYALTASHALNGGGSGVSSSYALTSSYASVAQNVLGSITSAATASYIGVGGTIVRSKVSGSLQITGSILNNPVNLGNSAGPVTLDFIRGDLQRLTLTGSATLSFSNTNTSSYYGMEVLQDNTGNWQLKFPTNVVWPYGLQLSSSLSAGSTDLYSIYFNGLDYYITSFASVVPSTASYAISASYALNGGGNGVSSSYAESSSVAQKLSPRQTTVYPVATIASASYSVGTLSLSEEFEIYTVSSSEDSRVRLYNLVSNRDGDLTRPVNIYPSYSAGVILDVVLSSSIRVVNMMPIAHGYGGTGSAATKTIAYTVNNLSPASSNVTMSLTYKVK